MNTTDQCSLRRSAVNELDERGVTLMRLAIKALPVASVIWLMSGAVEASAQGGAGPADISAVVGARFVQHSPIIPVGGARLDRHPDGVVLRSIGTLGEGGVSIPFTGGSSPYLHFRPIQMSEFSVLNFALRAEVDGRMRDVMVFHHRGLQNGQSQLLIGLQEVHESATLELYNRGTLVHSEQRHYEGRNIWPFIGLIILVNTSAEVSYSEAAGWAGKVNWNSPIPIDVGGGTVIDADVLVVRTNPIRARVGRMSLEIRGSEIPEIVFLRNPESQRQRR